MASQLGMVAKATGTALFYTESVEFQSPGSPLSPRGASLSAACSLG